MTDADFLSFVATMRKFVEAQNSFNEAALIQVKALQSRVVMLEGQVSTLSDHVHGLQAKRRVGRKPRA